MASLINLNFTIWKSYISKAHAGIPKFHEQKVAECELSLQRDTQNRCDFDKNIHSL